MVQEQIQPLTLAEELSVSGKFAQHPRECARMRACCLTGACVYFPSVTQALEAQGRASFIITSSAPNPKLGRLSAPALSVKVTNDDEPQTAPITD